MRPILRIILLILFCCAGVAQTIAATYELADGTTVVGEPLLSTASDAGVKLRMADGSYENIAWGRFSQKDLKKFAEDSRLTEYVEPFIEITPEEKAMMTHVDIKPVKRLSRPEAGSIIGSLFGSGVGWFLILVLFAANIYAGVEIATFRARNVWLVAGLAAIPFAGFISNIVWLSLPTYIKREPELTPEEEALEEALTPEFKVPLAGEIEAASAAAGPSAGYAAGGHGSTAAPKEEVFARGKFTFNRRFVETRFAAFFGVVRRGAAKSQVLVIKTPKAEIVADRITRITAVEMHVNATQGGSGEVNIPFAQIQEIRLKPQT